ncbi:hypothetical protein HQ584_13065, partial [Patescibacteria group bacterium]|nr:hypothetical protein [Patescibacteria group bacterium]
SVIEKADFDENETSKEELEEIEKLLKECYAYDTKINKYRLKQNLGLDSKNKILTFFDKKNKNNPTIDEELIVGIISDDKREYDWNQFNELLLLCNKDRIKEGFFDFFIRQRKSQGQQLSLSGVCDGIEYFRKYATLLCGNFKFAYRVLSKMEYPEIEDDLKVYLKNPENVKDQLAKRPPTIQNIDEVQPKDTYLLGYLSGAEVTIDIKASDILVELTNEFKKSWEDLKSEIDNHLRKNASKIDEGTSKRVKKVVTVFEKFCSEDIQEFQAFINLSADEIGKFLKRRQQILKKGVKNTQIYLAWDHMDVYLATSMRTKWEYEELCVMVEHVLKKNTDINKLKLRYFNPIQSYEDSNIDKGLIEGVMLKRAKCTIYSVQEIDTLGKDSELASTLAQGKPVIAYIRDIASIDERAKELKVMPLEFFRDKYYVLNKEGWFTKDKVINECSSWVKKSGKALPKMSTKEFVESFTNEITKLINRKAWSSIKTVWVDEENFKISQDEDFAKYCYFIASAEKYFYDKRAETLSKTHPLRLQISLSTGVANGVLVVRTHAQCAQLLKKIISNELYYNLDFELIHDEENRCWVLKETISGCAYRVVTDNFKLTNSFWNFYRDKKGGDYAKGLCRVE